MLRNQVMDIAENSKVRTNTMTKNGKKSLLFISGGVSAEREIALLSSQNVFPFLDSQHFDIFAVFISTNGCWHLVPKKFQTSWTGLEKLAADLPHVQLSPTAMGLELCGGKVQRQLDLIFPMMHGPCGEDGSIQGLAQFFAVPVVGSDMPGSLINMDKVLMKMVLEQQKIPTARYRSFYRAELAELQRESGSNSEEAFSKLGGELLQLWGCQSLYVKPARMGSSIGMSQVKNPGGLGTAVQLALQFDDKILIEEGFFALELELAALELDSRYLLLSNAAQIRSRGEFYSYEQKYFPEGLEHSLVVEAHNNLSAEVLQRAKKLAHKAFRSLGARHYARIDLFYLEEDDRLLLNEINTIPGFTAHSMFPQLLAAEGWPMERLVPHLLQLGLSGFK